MTEKVNRKTGQSIYQPRIHAQRIKDLYQIKEKTGLPMTVLVDQALGEFLKNGDNFTALKTTIADILGSYDGLCMDNPEEREILAVALANALFKKDESTYNADSCQWEDVQNGIRPGGKDV